MKRISTIGLLCLCLAFFNVAQAEVATPAEAVKQVKQNAQEVLKILSKSNGANNLAVRKEAEDYALPYFDYERMTALAVGRPWKNATAKQKQELTREFQTLLIRTYSGTMLEFKDAQVNIKDNPVVNKNGREIVVQAEIKANKANAKPVRMDYTLYHSGNKFRIYNIAVEGSSLVTVYRNQFNDVINKSGIDGLVTQLSEKNSSGRE